MGRARSFTKQSSSTLARAHTRRTASHRLSNTRDRRNPSQYNTKIIRLMKDYRPDRFDDHVCVFLHRGPRNPVPPNLSSPAPLSDRRSQGQPSSPQNNKPLPAKKNHTSGTLLAAPAHSHDEVSLCVPKHPSATSTASPSSDRDMIPGSYHGPRRLVPGSLTRQLT